MAKATLVAAVAINNNSGSESNPHVWILKDTIIHVMLATLMEWKAKANDNTKRSIEGTLVTGA